MVSRETWNGIVIGTVITIIVSIPVQLLTSLLFPGVQRWLDARSKARAFRKSDQMKKEYEQAYYFVLYPHRMTHYFLNRGLEIFRLAVFLLIFVIVSPWLHSPTKWWWGLLWTLSFGCVVFFIIIIITQTVNRLHEIYYRVEFWGEYQKKVALDLPDIEIKPLPAGR